MATRKELIASDKTVEEIRQILGVDSLGYLSIDSWWNVSALKGMNYVWDVSPESTQPNYLLTSMNMSLADVKSQYKSF